MYFNYLEILLAILVIFVIGWSVGFMVGDAKKGRRLRKHHELFSDVGVEFLHWALGDPKDSSSLLLELPQSLDDRQQNAHTLLFLVQGTLHRDSGAPQKALRIHQSLLAKPDLDKNLRGVIEFQCALDLFGLKRFAEAEEILQKLPRKWKNTESVRSLRARLETARQEDTAS